MYKKKPGVALHLVVPFRRFGKNVVKSFYTAYILYDVLEVFGELSPECGQLRKYAKWKATYIHNCLKNGQTPVAGPVAMEGEEEFEGIGDAAVGGQPEAAAAAAQPPEAPGWMQPQIPSSSGAATPAAYVPVPVQPEVPSPTPAAALPALAEGVANIQLTPELSSQAQKYCKYAVSALDYDDRMTAINNLTKALNLLKTGTCGN